LLLLAACFSTAEAVAREPEAINPEFDVEVYSQQGTTIGCGLSFLFSWTNSELQVLAVNGSLNFFVPDRANIGSVFRVRATLNNEDKALSFAWISVPGVESTKSFSPLAQRQPPFYPFFQKPDRAGLARLTAAARTGFTLGLTVVGLPLDETVHAPPVPRDVSVRLEECTRELAIRRARLEAS
jgi:hypothetical protein